MLGFAPLAALPLASAGAALVLVSAPMSATGGITFTGTANAGTKTRMAAAGGLTFGGSATPTIEVYRSATGGITFGGNPVLLTAGEPFQFYAIPDRFDFRADGADFAFQAVPQSFTFRGAL